MSWPCLAKPSVIEILLHRETVSVIECASAVTTECTPHTTAKRRATSVEGVRPMIGASGRSRAARRAVLPEAVKPQMAAAPIVCAT